MRRAFAGRLALVFTLTVPIALFFACGGDDFGDDSSDDAGAPGAPAAPGGEPAGAEAPAADGESAGTAQVGRKIVREAQLDLVINDLDGALDQVRSIARGAGGLVSDSRIVVNDAEDPAVAKPETAVITLRVPVDTFEEVMQQLRDGALGVDFEESGLTEVTGEYTDLESRLRNLQAAENQYVTLLGRAASIDEIIRVQEKIDAVRGQIEQVQGRLNVLDDQTELATITVTLRLAPVAVAAEAESHWAIQAFEVSWEASEAIFVALGTLAIAGGFVTLWLLPPTLTVYVVWRRFGPAIAGLARKLG